MAERLPDKNKSNFPTILIDNIIRQKLQTERERKKGIVFSIVLNRKTPSKENPSKD